MEEIFDIYDRKGNYLGKKSKKQCHSYNPGFYHKPVWIWITNSNHEILVQKRASRKKSCPNLGVVSCGGHVVSEEHSIDGAIREIKEELGISTSERAFNFIREYINDETYEIAQIYKIELDIPIENFVLQTEEVSQVKWLKYGDFKKIFLSNNFVPYNND